MEKNKLVDSYDWEVKAYALIENAIADYELSCEALIDGVVAIDLKETSEEEALKKICGLVHDICKAFIFALKTLKEKAGSISEGLKVGYLESMKETYEPIKPFVEKLKGSDNLLILSMMKRI